VSAAAGLRVKSEWLDLTGVAGWHSGKPDFDAFDRTTRSANELLEGCPILA
jgi:hypothetical protein